MLLVLILRGADSLRRRAVLVRWMDLESVGCQAEPVDTENYSSCGIELVLDCNSEQGGIAVEVEIEGYTFWEVGRIELIHLA